MREKSSMAPSRAVDTTTYLADVSLTTDHRPFSFASSTYPSPLPCTFLYFNQHLNLYCTSKEHRTCLNCNFVARDIGSKNTGYSTRTPCLTHPFRAAPRASSIPWERLLQLKISTDTISRPRRHQAHPAMAGSMRSRQSWSTQRATTSSMLALYPFIRYEPIPLDSTCLQTCRSRSRNRSRNRSPHHSLPPSSKPPPPEATRSTITPALATPHVHTSNDTSQRS
jgi:hypothetical protein